MLGPAWNSNAMEFVESLHHALSINKPNDHKRQFNLAAVRLWNDNVEASFCNSASEAINLSEPEPGKLELTAILLGNLLVFSMLRLCCHEGMIFNYDSAVVFSGTIDSDAVADKAASNAASFVRANFNSIKDTEELRTIAELLRASKNLLRYNSQVILPRLESRPDKSFIHRLSSHGMLDSYLALLESRQNDSARFASLALFYSTYNPMGDSFIAMSLTHLVTDLNFLKVLAELLLQARPPDFVLTLVRHVHNLVTSVQGASHQINAYLKLYEECDAPWLENRSSKLDLELLLVSISNWCLNSDPKFPGDSRDRRADILSICLQILFTLRAGANLLRSDEERMANQLVISVLQLSDQGNSRVTECKISLVSMLMDAPPGFSMYLVQQQCMNPLLALFEELVTDVVDNRKSGTQAAATLTPILIVLNNVSIANPDALKMVKSYVFPPEREEAFQKKAREELRRSTSDIIGAKNMSPLDAEKGTLRWKLIRLQTWTESHTKRLTNELLWTLCGSDAKEFVLRTGFGNAMPHLACKGIVSLPTEMSRR